VRFDPGLMLLRSAVVQTAAMLASYGSALLLEHVAHLHVDIVMQAAVLGLTTSRVQRATATRKRLPAFAVVPVVAMGAFEIGRLMGTHPNIGDALFVFAVALSIWVRRFGAWASRIGILMVLPLVATLVLQGQAAGFEAQLYTLWLGLVGLVACGWAFLLQEAAERTGLVRLPTTPAAAPAPPRKARILTSTKMALQMATALGTAFFAGRELWPAHWSWTVLTAFIVGSAARSRGDVLLKGVLRIIGAAIGTIVATEVAGSFGPHTDVAVVLIFAVIAVATWLREASYLYWAACVTAVLSLLYGWFGESTDGLLRTRLEGIGLGAAIGITAAWAVLPIRTRAAVQLRTAAALAELAVLLGAEAWADRARLLRQSAQFERCCMLIGQLAPSVNAQRWLEVRLLGRRSKAYAADAVEALQESVQPARVIVQAALELGESRDSPAVVAARNGVAANAAAIRKAIGRKPGRAYAPVLMGDPASEGAAAARVLGALAQIDAALGQIARCFPQVADCDLAGSRANFAGDGAGAGQPHGTGSRSLTTGFAPDAASLEEDIAGSAAHNHARQEGQL
jgi:hypothetical protein